MEILLEKWSKNLNGVFSTADLRVLFKDSSEASVYRAVKKLVETGYLIKIKKGLYSRPNVSLEVISSRIEPKSYISTGTVLSKTAIIGSIPAKRVQAVKIGPPRKYTFEFGTIEHLSISPKFYFGFKAKDGHLYATPEKAFLDVCYFYYKGNSFSFDPLQDIHIDALDKNLVFKYLNKFNPPFKTFFSKTWFPSEY